MTTYTDLRDMVVSGQLDPVVRVAESELASRLGVSRTPVREALYRLEGDGLIVGQGRGVRVRVMDVDEMLDLLTARAGLEAWAVYQAARRVSAGEVPPARITELERLAEEAHQLTSTGDIEGGANSNRRFHERMAALAGSGTIDTTLAQWWDRIIVSTRHTIQIPARVAEVHCEHGTILAALRRGDPIAASDATRTHTLNTRDMLSHLHEGNHP